MSPRRIVDNYDDVIEESESSKQPKQNGLLNVTITPKTQLDKKLPIKMPVQNETLKVGVHDYACIINHIHRKIYNTVYNCYI